MSDPVRMAAVRRLIALERGAKSALQLQQLHQKAWQQARADQDAYYEAARQLRAALGGEVSDAECAEAQASASDDRWNAPKYEDDGFGGLRRVTPV